MEENNNVEVLEEKNEVQEIKSEAAPIQPKKKGNGGLIVVIVLLLAVCIGLGGFVFINKDKLFSSNEPKETKEKKETKKEEKAPVVTTYAVTDEKVASLIDNLLNYKETICGKITLLAMDKKFEVKDIDSSGAWLIVLSDLGAKDTITLDEVNNTIKKYLGKDYTFEPKSVLSSNCAGTYEYDESTKAFNKKPNTGGCGGTCGPAASSYRMVKAVDTDGVLKLDVKVVFGSEGVNNGNYTAFYSDYARTNVIGDSNQSKVEDLYEKGSNYQFTFKLEDGNYVFVSSEPVK